MDNNNMYNQGASDNQDNQINPNNQGSQGNEQPVYQQPVYQQSVYQQPYPQSYQTYQQPYQQPYPQEDSGLEEPVSFGDWMITRLILCIPCVGLVMMFVWAFGSSTKKSKSNYFKAALVWALISMVVSVIVFVAILAAIGGFAAIMDGAPYYYY